MSEVRYGRGVAIAALALGYALLAHYTNTNSQHETLGTLVALSPIVLAVLVMSWNSRYRIAVIAAMGVGGVLLVTAWNTVGHHYNYIYWTEHAGSQLVLCMVFARTLSPGRDPMCTYFARVVHGSITPVIEHYSRQVTVAWVFFFGLMAATSTAIFFTCPLATWSVFANFFTAPLIGMMFVVEYGVRRLVHPEMEHAHILDTIVAVWKQQAGPPAR